MKKSRTCLIFALLVLVAARAFAQTVIDSTLEVTASQTMTGDYVIASGGSLAIGDPLDWASVTLTVAGNLTLQNAGAISEIQNRYNTLAVDGVFTIDGGAVGTETDNRLHIENRGFVDIKSGAMNLRTLNFFAGNGQMSGGEITLSSQFGIYAGTHTTFPMTGGRITTEGAILSAYAGTDLSQSSRLYMTLSGNSVIRIAQGSSDPFCLGNGILFPEGQYPSLAKGKSTFLRIADNAFIDANLAVIDYNAELTIELSQASMDEAKLSTQMLGFGIDSSAVGEHSVIIDGSQLTAPTDLPVQHVLFEIDKAGMLVVVMRDVDRFNADGTKIESDDMVSASADRADIIAFLETYNLISFANFDEEAWGELSIAKNIDVMDNMNNDGSILIVFQAAPIPEPSAAAALLALLALAAVARRR